MDIFSEKKNLNFVYFVFFKENLISMKIEIEIELWRFIEI